jgi:DeoR/GlpR family transcriptional regulator of sugar metabolism
MIANEFEEEEEEKLEKRSITAFFSCSFHEREEEIVQYFKTIAMQCRVIPVIANKPGVGPISEKVQDLIHKQDAFVAILTEKNLESHQASAWINNEIGIAVALEKPIIVFKENSIDDLGIIPNITEYVIFSRDDLPSILGNAYKFFSDLHNNIVIESITSQTKRNEIEYVNKYGDLYDARLVINLPAKNKIAEIVYKKFIAPINSPVILGSGTVTYCIAEHIVTRGKIIPIVTNNVAIATDMDSVYHHPIHLLSGEIDRVVMATTGPAAAEQARIWLKDKEPKALLAVMGLRSFEPLKGFAEDKVSLNEFQATLLREAEKLVIVAQGEKFIKPVENPIMPYSEFLSILNKRRNDHSISLVCHEPTLELSEETKIRYDTILSKLIELIDKEYVTIIEN